MAANVYLVPEELIERIRDVLLMAQGQHESVLHHLDEEVNSGLEDKVSANLIALKQMQQDLLFQCAILNEPGRYVEMLQAVLDHEFGGERAKRPPYRRHRVPAFGLMVAIRLASKEDKDVYPE